MSEFHHESERASALHRQDTESYVLDVVIKAIIAKQEFPLQAVLETIYEEGYALGSETAEEMVCTAEDMYHRMWSIAHPS